jgi:hypothetical protein
MTEANDSGFDEGKRKRAIELAISEMAACKEITYKSDDAKSLIKSADNIFKYIKEGIIPT